MSVWTKGSNIPDPKILAAAASDDTGCDRVFNFSLCRLRHLAEREKERRGQRLEFEPCAYCPKIIEALTKPMSPPAPIQEEPEPMKTEPEKAEKKRCEVCKNWLTKNGYCHSCAATARAKKNDDKPTLKTGVTAICVECKKPGKIAALSLCWKCYVQPEIKSKYKSLQASSGQALATKPPKIPVSIPGVGECFGSAAEANPWPPVEAEVESPQNLSEEEFEPGRCPDCGKPTPYNLLCSACVNKKRARLVSDAKIESCRHIIGGIHQGVCDRFIYIDTEMIHTDEDKRSIELSIFPFCPKCGIKLVLKETVVPYRLKTSWEIVDAPQGAES